MNNFNNKVIYQVYPLSFNDSNHDGKGDINGIISKLKYLSNLSVDYIWLSPIYLSPMIDNGYDVADYKKINPTFGTMHDFDKLIKEAKKFNIKIMMDIVMNHTSDKNDWFVKSTKKIKPYDKYYVWSKKPSHKFSSQFENDAWTYNKVRKEYYLHHFAKEQPDLNWDSEHVEKEFVDILNFWIDKGVGGFRFDVVDMLGKNIKTGKTIVINEAYKKIKTLGQQSWLKHELFTVGEVWSTNRKNQQKYINSKNGVFTTAFNAAYMFKNFHNSRWDLIPLKGADFVEMKKWVFETRNRLEGKVNLANFIENHDFPRSISRYFSNDGFFKEKAKIILISFFGFNGPSFIYQGQELGMSNPKFNLNDYNDPETKKFIKNNDFNLNQRANAGTRDNARSMINWTTKVKKMWLKYKEENPVFASEQVNDKNSTYSTYKKFFEFKKNHQKFFENATFEQLMVEDKRVFAYKYFYKKDTIYFIANWSNENIKLIKNLPIRNINKYESYVYFNKERII